MKKELLYIAVFILSIYIVSSITIIPTTFSKEANVSSTYTITVDNTNEGEIAKITQVDITIPGSFTFIAGSNSTSAIFESFTNTSTVLSWINSTIYLINGSESKTFSFNAIASTFGDYNLTVTSTNATGPFSENILVTIQDTTDPSISFESPTPANNANLDQSYISINVTASDNVAIHTITLELYSETDTLLDSTTSTTSPFAHNFTGLSNGTYKIDATVNDTSGNEDSLNRRTINLGTVPSSTCIQNWNCTSWTPAICPENETQTRTCTDLSYCGNNTGKPAETQSCTFGSGCTPDWNCTTWSECLDQSQSRTCTDTNSCGVSTSKPDETQSCEEGTGNSTIIIISVVIAIVLVIIGVFFFLKGRTQQPPQPQPQVRFGAAPRPPPPAGYPGGYR